MNAPIPWSSSSPACVRTPRTTGKAKPVIRTLLALWHDKSCCESAAHSTTELRGFLNDYNGVRRHKGSNGLTPEQKLFIKPLPLL